MTSLRPLADVHRLLPVLLLAASAAAGPGTVGSRPAATQAATVTSQPAAVQAANAAQPAGTFEAAASAPQAAPAHPAANAPQPALPGPAAPARDDSALREALVQGIAMGLPGISVAIGLGDSLAWVGTAGYADLEERAPVEPEDLFGVGSITKTLVARVVLQLAEEGLVALDRPATEYVDLEVVRRVPNADRATLRQLMNHQSGVPTWEFQEDWIRRGRGEAMELGRVWGRTETLEYSTADVLPAPHAPGARYAYSNTNYTLLGLVVEAVTGNDAADEIRRRILEPLGMEETFLESFEPVPGGYVSHYHYATPRFREVAGVHPAFEEVRPYLVESSAANLSPEWTAGGMVASARDLVRWARALRDGELLGAEMQEEVFAWYPPDDGGRPGSRYLQGIAWSQDFFGELDAFGHSGGTLGFTAFMYWLEDTDVIAVLLTNVGGMHSGLSPSPPGLFFRQVWLPAVMDWVEG
jgi:D-alanyl-D-alanine carboxypeptidase